MELTGKVIDRYQVVEQIGEGGMSHVYKAFDTKLECDVAIKVIRTERLTIELMEKTIERFKREAKSLAHLTHPNIVKVIDYGEFEDKPYLVMEYLPGGTLKDRLGKPIRWDQATAILLPIARALDYAHGQGIVHRDVKPSNILITESGEPMLSDFGIAKLFDTEATAELTGTSTSVGTPEYMAPEQATSKHVDHRVDIYALGIVMYEMITGRKPFEADTPLAVLFKHASEPLPSPSRMVSGLPEQVEQFLLRALAKNPEDRFEDMGEMAIALEELVEGRTMIMPVRKESKKKDSRKRPKQATKKPAQEKNKHGLAWALGAFGIFAILATGMTLGFPNIFDDPLVSTASPFPTGISIESTPTLGLPLGYVLVSSLSGDVVYEIPGQDAKKLVEGDTVPSGAGAFIETRDGIARIILPNQSVVYLDHDTRLELIQVADARGGLTANHLKIDHGEILTIVELLDGETFLVDTPIGAWAEVIGSVMGVVYEPSSQFFQMDCIEGHCRQGGIGGNKLDLSGGESSLLYAGGDPEFNGQSNNETWRELVKHFNDPVDFIPVLSTPTPTSTVEENGGSIPTATSPRPTVAIRTSTPAPTFTATPVPICYSLTTSAANGSVDVSPAPNCQGSKYIEGTTVSLSASPNSGYYFDKWSGDATGSNNPLTMSMSGNKSITAVFVQIPPDYTLTTSVSPAGGGSVGLSPAGGTYTSGTTVTLSASPSTGYIFSNWSGPVNNATANPTTITMDGDKSVTANFAECYSLALTASGPGSVDASPSPNCSGGKYIPGTVVTITASASSSSAFISWSGSVTGSTNPTTVTMNGNKSITGNFSACYSLSTGVSGSGTVGISPSPNCGSKYISGTSVTLTAYPNSGNSFSSWSGSITSTSNPVTFSMNSDKSVTANFASIPCYTLSTSVNPAGAGSITVNTPQNCSGGYTSGTSVSLSLSTTSGYVFSSWSGCSGNSSGCTLTITGNASVTANFTLIQYTLSVSKSGSGTVTSSPAGINCGSDCSEAYNYNTSVTLTPTASSGYTFSGWSGDADCSDGTVTMNANKSCTANFSAVQYTLSVSKNGTGSGTVTSSPSGISCGSTCSASYNANTTVTLTASPNSSSTFSGWSGACSGMTCTVTMSAAKSVTATFTLIPPPAAPSNLSVQFYNKSGGYIIYRATWTDNSNNETDFEIIWTGLPISLFDSYLPANTTSTYSPSNGYVCGTYNAQTFMVRAVNNGGESSWVSKSFDWSAYCP